MGSLEALAAQLMGADVQKQIAEQNPYYQFQAVPNAWNQSLQGYQPTSRSEMWQKAAAQSLGGLLGAGLQGFGEQYQNTLQDRYENSLASAIAGRENPSGLPQGLFGLAKRGGSLWNMLGAAKEQENAQELAKQRQLLLIEKPWLANMGAQASSSGAPIPVAVTKPNPLKEALKTGKASTEERQNEIYQSYLQQGMPPQQAAVSAREMIKGEIKANTSSYDQAAKAREYAEKLLELANRAEFGLDEAGQTGPGDTVRGARLWAQSFISPEAERRYGGRQALEAIKPDLVKMGRTPGAVSDYEAKMILSGGPTTDKTKEVNNALVNNWKELAAYHQDYADFLEAFREVNGSTTGANKLWNEYRKAFPLYQESLGEKGASGKVNYERPSWQEFFTNKLTGTSAAAKPDVPAGYKLQQNKQTGEYRVVPK